MFRRALTSTSILSRAVAPARSVQRTAGILSLRGYATRKYTPEHEWVSVDGQGVGTIGITDYAAKALGDVVFVEIPTVGTAIEAKEQVSAVESVKAASDVYAPISGEVVEVNDALGNEPSLINSSPFDKGWIAKIKISDKGQLNALMDEAAYADHIKE
ncbi:hypothetical protein PhCBS80983_g05086 [Powellomyces hirtus]|uniref:Glycine cleavage system H protein n=1 Tax=Powellomyces hirtus TaxID=109895 RepID=A0A507DVG9_9FUNG|nr:hypothetical protein PhCBS80983_g05086 [Powellomyces hirtus]